MYPIIDLHCDLLSFFAEVGKVDLQDPSSRCSYPQMSSGGVSLQTMAIFTPTHKNCVSQGEAQARAFLELSKQPGITRADNPNSSCISVIAAIENASAFALEDEPLDKALARLDSYRKLVGPIFYISLTWNDVNRFGGPAGSVVGLKEDGKRLLEYLNKAKTAIDLSHASDSLACDILSYIDQKQLKIPVIASHSNYREICPMARNLPKELAQEIISRKGLIGLNLFGAFIDPKNPAALEEHIEYALGLGAEDCLAFGADFFSTAQFDDLLEKYSGASFFPEMADASCYPSILHKMKNKIPDSTLKKIAYQNAQTFLDRHVLN